MQNYMGLAPHVTGTVDVDAMADAFDALLQAHPILNAHLERRSDGRHQFVVDDLLHPGIRVLESAQGPPNGADVHLDQYVSLINLDVRPTDRGAELCLYIHHSLADAHHQFALAHELFGYYTDLVQVDQSAQDAGGVYSGNTSTAGNGTVQSLQGTVRQIDRSNGLFTLDVGNYQTLTVSMPYNPTQNDQNRFQNLRAGEAVRFYGVFLNNSRVELRRFY